MNKKCTKYESLFTFRNQEELDEHISACPDCAAVQDEMDKVSALIQEVKPYYKKQRRQFKIAKIACTLLLFIFCGATVGILSTNTDITDTLTYGQVLSAEDLGLPVDSYGLIMVE